MAIRFLVSLDEIEPPVWRRVALDGRITLYGLHQVLQLLFEWLDYHLYEFEVRGERYAPQFAEEQGGNTPETSLNELGLHEGDQIRYVYDMDNRWQHTLLVENVIRLDEDDWTSSVSAGERAGPPENCGGIEAYQELLGVLGNPAADEYAEVRASVGADYDPERFDVRAVNHALGLMAAWGGIQSNG